MKYVAGFYFSRDSVTNALGEPSVALICKNKPAWQKGRYNAIGGKIEPLESPLQAMIREFREETSVCEQNWEPFCNITCNGDTVFFFKAWGDPRECKTVEDERVELITISDILLSRIDTISNLRWLIPLALDSKLLPCVIKYKE